MKNLYRINSRHAKSENWPERGPGLGSDQWSDPVHGPQHDPEQGVAYTLSLFKSAKHVLVICVVIAITILVNVVAMAAHAASVKHIDREPIVYKTPFSAAIHDSERMLDWRSPVVSLPFTLPENDWIDRIELLISAQPEGRVSPTTPLLIRFNEAPAVPVYSDGNGFDARIKLDTTFLRGLGNTIRVEYQTPPGKACLASEHGAWALNVKDSQVVIHARTKARPPSFNDVKTRLKDRATAPKSVSIVATGAHQTRLQALAAQGISLNMDGLPNFRLKAGAADHTVIIGTRDDLPPYVKEAAIHDALGPTIAVSQSRSNVLVITGDTDADVLKATQAFATHPIPTTRQHALGASEFYGSGAFPQTVKLGAGKVKLSKLGLSQFAPGWHPAPQHLFFDVADPASNSGTLELKTFMDDAVSSHSVLNVRLNGETLGQIPVAGSRSVQTIDIPQGLLRGLGNHLTLEADLYPQNTAEGCRARQDVPRLAVSAKSTLMLNSDYMSARTDLSRFAATGLPFAKKNGARTTVLIASQSDTDREAALKLMAKLARASGTGWADAEILDATPENWPADGHVFIIGSDIDDLSPVLDTAPISLASAITGQSRQEPRVMKSAHGHPPAETVLSSRALVTGGVAAIYHDTDNAGRLIGVMTGSPGHSFSKAVAQIVKPQHWNQLEGSVARWDQDTVLMAQTAIRLKTPPQDQKLWARITSSVSTKLNAIKWPDVDVWKNKVANIFENKSAVTPALQLHEATPPNPILRTENMATPMERLSSAVPVPMLKPEPAQPGDVNAEHNAPPAALNSLQSQSHLAPAKPSLIGGVTANINQAYKMSSARLSGFMKDVFANQGYASKSNRAGVLLMSLMATFMLLLAAVLMPTRKQ